MKKILALFLCLLMVCTSLVMTSCDEKDDPKIDEETTVAQTTEAKPVKLTDLSPKAVYEAAEKKMESISNYTVIMKQTITMLDDPTAEKQEQTITMQIHSEDNLYMSADSNGTESDMTIWYVDGMMYVNMLGMKVKEEMDPEEFEEQNGTAGSNDMPTLPDSIFEGKKLVAEGNLYYLDLTMPASVYEEQMGSLSEEIGLSTSIAGDVDCRVYFNESGMMTSMTFAMKATIAGMSVSIRSVAEFTKIGMTAKVSAPADAEAYISSGEIY